MKYKRSTVELFSEIRNVGKEVIFELIADMQYEMIN